MKRFCETTKWDDPWFRRLKPRYKSFIQFLWDRCDHTGVWVVDIELATTYVGEKIDPEEALKYFDGRVVDMGNGKWLIPQFISFQYGTLSPQCHPHRKILESLNRHGLKIGENGRTTLSSTLNTTLPSRVQDKDKEEDKEKEGVQGEETPRYGRMVKPAEEEVITFFISQELPASDGRWFFNKCEGNGWKNGGEPIKDWKRTVIAWKLARYFPSQRVNGSHAQTASNKRNEGMTNKVTAESGSRIAAAARATINQPNAR